MPVRFDGRANFECGITSGELGVFYSSLNGSAEYSIGLSKVYATVWRPEEISSIKCRPYIDVIIRPRTGHIQEYHKLTEYNITNILEKIIDFSLLPRSVISIALQIVSEDGPILPLCFNAAVMGLFDLGVPMKCFPFATSIAETRAFYGYQESKSRLVIDPTNIEYEKCINCSTFIVNTNKNEIISCITNKGAGVSQNKSIEGFSPNNISIAASKTMNGYITQVVMESVKDKLIKQYNNNLF
ncbi:hypothetical protein FG386_000822 [Cryptosporidium ryanae]|uniref:uncharacterized protein n=1 Tax=Cryptosporidium ryanae TaxID=515981 RepID=UPI00351A667F|nr:hypothetical protein FG386_000822 [Cryptosporidium ryanae]